MNPFEFLNQINYGKNDIMVDDLVEKDYNSFMVNRGLSYFNDSVIFANEMNINHHVDSRLQFDFLINIIRKRKRFSKTPAWRKSGSLSIWSRSTSSGASSGTASSVQMVASERS